MNLKTRKLIDISLAFALISCICLSMTAFADSCEDMYENIIRIRIIANSDSEEDQRLKIKVRDAVLDYSQEIFSGIDSYDEAVSISENNIDKLRDKACETVLKNGYNYSVGLEMRPETFDTRKYDNFTLPAGRYETLVFTIGEGKGENWWCVMFPQVCVGACSGRLTDTVTATSAQYAENADRYVLKFKVVELFEKIRKNI